MLNREPLKQTKRKSRRKFSDRVFKATGVSLANLMKIGGALVILLLGIGWTVLYNDAELAGRTSGIEGVETKRLTSEEQFMAVCRLPNNFAEKLPVERIGILNSKIKAGEELASSGGQYAQRGTKQLVLLYGARCNVEELQGLATEKTYARLAELRKEAVAEKNEETVAATDYACACSAVCRLGRSTEKVDFNFAADAISKLDSKKLLNTVEIKNLYGSVIKLHDDSSAQDSTAIFLTLLGDKLIGSPVSEVSEMGMSLKDYPKYLRFYKEVHSKQYRDRDSKIQFYRDLFAKIDEAPPQSIGTYQVIFQLLDKLLTTSEAHLAGLLTKRLAKAASTLKPEIRTKVDQSIKNIGKRIATIGVKVDLSGSTFKGVPLNLPNGKPTTIVFWQVNNLESLKHIKSLADSDGFEPWEANVLMAGLSPLDEKQFKDAEKIVGRFTILDNETAIRMGNQFFIEFLPYHISLDKDGKAIRLGSPAD